MATTDQPTHRSPVRAPEHVQALLDRLHSLSEAQEPTVRAQLQSARRLRQEDVAAGDLELDGAMRDKFVALDRDKCDFVHQLILAKGATVVIEAGTSFGVSTIYLALAVGEVLSRQIAAGTAPHGAVIATEKEKDKAALARSHWAEAGDAVLERIDLREGDLLRTLSTGIPRAGVDLLLLDIWPPLALPILKLVEPHLKSGAVVITDNTVASAAGYAALLAYLRDPQGPFTTQTLPFSGGLELSVYWPARAS